MVAGAIAGFPFLQAFLKPPPAESLEFVVTLAPRPATVTVQPSTVTAVPTVSVTPLPVVSENENIGQVQVNVKPTATSSFTPTPTGSGPPTPSKTQRPSAGATATDTNCCPTTEGNPHPENVAPTSTFTETHSPLFSEEESLGDLLLSLDQNLTPTPRPVPTPYPEESSPSRLVIPSIALDAEVVKVGLEVQTIDGQPVLSWGVPDLKAAGWHIDSAPPGFPGNTVLNGHHNIKGEVFRYLEKLEPGAEVVIYAGDEAHYYTVAERHILKDKYESLEVHIQNAQWVLPTDDERLTLVTCWPYTNNTHRLIVVALPMRPTPTPRPIRE